MARRRRTPVSSTARKWLLGVLLAVLAIGSIMLTLLALDHVRTRPAGGDVAPVPTFTQPSQETPSPTPSETSATTESYDRSQERFLAVSAGVLWRGTAGQCGDVDPLLERSTDGGQTWTDSTPHYLGIGELVALNRFADGQAEIIALMGPDCEVQALRTFTQGQFWESYPDVLAASRYIVPADPGNIVSSDSPITAPCSDARSLRTAGSLIVMVCDDTAYVLDQDDEWLALPSTNATAVNANGDEIFVAHVSEQCNGIKLTRFTLADEETPHDAGCAENADPEQPMAIAASDGAPLIWSADTTVAFTG